MISKLSKILCAVMFFTLAFMPVIAFALTSINSKIKGNEWIIAKSISKDYGDEKSTDSVNKNIETVEDEKEEVKIKEGNKQKVSKSKSNSQSSYSSLAQIVSSENSNVEQILSNEIVNVTLPAPDSSDNYEELQNIIESGGDAIEEALQNDIPLCSTGAPEEDIMGLVEPNEHYKIPIKISEIVDDELLIAELK